MPDRSKVITQTKRDTLVLQVAGFDLELIIKTHKKCSVEKPLKLETGRKFWKRLRSAKTCNDRKKKDDVGHYI
jgi:hypothetical protein